MLGVLPGGGGTQRLLKLAGLPNTLDLALTGKSLKAKKAKSMGLVDLVVDSLGPGMKPADINTHEYLLKIATDVARDLGSGKMKLPNRSPSTLSKKLTNWVLSIGQVKDYVFNTAREKVMKQTGGLYPAPLKILDVLRVGADKGSAAGYEAESKGFGELCVTSESKALISLFHGQTECKKNKIGQPAKKAQ